jgi:hypothetical protein
MDLCSCAQAKAQQTWVNCQTKEKMMCQVCSAQLEQSHCALPGMQPKIPDLLTRNKVGAFEQNQQQNCQFRARAHIEVTRGNRLTKLSAFYSAGDACCNL